MTPDFARRHIGRAALFLAAALCLSACGSNPVTGAVSGLFGGGDDVDSAPATEDRISILALEDTIEADPRFAGMELSLPPAYRNDSWTQPGGEADHTLHHLTGALDFNILWRANIGKASQRAVLTAPPIAADGRLYVIDAQTRVSALEMETGEVIWQAELAPEIKERFRLREIFTRPKAAEIGFGGGVAYEGGRLFVTSGFGFAAALNAQSGEVLWRYETDAPVRTPPTAHRGAVFFVTNTNEFISLNQATGELNWNYQSFEETARILSSSSPAAAGDLVVAPFSSGEVIGFLSDSGRAVWSETMSRSASLTALATLNDIAGSPVIDRGLVYVVSHAGRLSAIDIRTGGVVWEVTVASLQMPWVAGDYIFVISVDSQLVCVSREDGAVLWVSDLPRYEKPKNRKGRIAWAGPVLIDGHLVLVSTRGEIVKVSAQDGSIVETKKLGDGFIVSPIIADGTIFVLNEKGRLIALR